MSFSTNDNIVTSTDPFANMLVIRNRSTDCNNPQLWMCSFDLIFDAFIDNLFQNVTSIVTGQHM